MDTISIKTLEALLDEEGPEVIRTRLGSRLSEEGHALLDEVEREMAEMDTLLGETGSHFMEELGDVPKVKLPPELLIPKETTPENRPDFDEAPNNVIWFRRPVAVNPGVLSAAALVLISFAGFMGSQIQKSAPDPFAGVSINTRGTSNISGMEEVNRKLYDAFMERGLLQLNSANQSKDEALLRQALQDFHQAHALFPSELRALENLILLYEQLGDTAKSQHYFKLLEKVEAESQ